MSVAERTKGWCPGALRPMASGDGLVVRLRLSCGEAPLALASDIADWAEAYGSGALDLSARGHLQIRGVSEATLPALAERLAAAGLLDASPDAESVRNALVSPFAGLDSEAMDVRPYAKALERELTSNPELWALPGKFGFSFDSGAFPLGDDLADIAFVAVAPRGFLVHLAGAPALGPFPARDVVAVALRLARAFLALRAAPSPPRRMRDAPPDEMTKAAGLPQTNIPPRPRRGPQEWLGAHALGDRAFVGFAAPFGRIVAADLSALVEAAREAGGEAMRITPWRALLAPVPTLAAARRLAGEARGFLLDPADPLLAVAACPGAPDCSSALGETRDLARRLARAGLHVSGCAKGCAHPQAAALTVVATPRGYDLVRNGRADAAPVARGLTPGALALMLDNIA